MAQARLYERAAAEDKSSSLLHASKGVTFWAGIAGHLARHQGGAPVLLAGLHGNFRLRLQGTPWVWCRTAIVPPSVWHELDFAGEPFAALYIEQNLGGLNAPMPLLSITGEIGGVALGNSKEIPLLRPFYEDLSSEHWVEQALSDLIAFSTRKISASPLDPRIASIAELLHGRGTGTAPVDQIARHAGLSSSRFQHLFTGQVGVPFRRYRAWQRLRIAWQEIASGTSIATAAHASGFFDSAHFAHEYRRTFGKACFDGAGRRARTTGHAYYRPPDVPPHLRRGGARSTGASMRGLPDGGNLPLLNAITLYIWVDSGSLCICNTIA